MTVDPEFMKEGEDHTKLAVAARSMDKGSSSDFVHRRGGLTFVRGLFSSQFYRDILNTELMIATAACHADGYAVPQVRKHIYGLFGRSYGINGRQRCYFRLPLMLWEDAFNDRFNKYGIDARQVLENDPRLYELRGEIMTGFMRDVRKVLDDVQNAQGRTERYELMASVVHNENDNKKYGLDVERWVKEGLIDKISIFPQPHTAQAPVEMEGSDYYKGLKVEDPLMIGWRLSSYDDAIKTAREFYARAAGLSSGSFPSGMYSPRPPALGRHYQRAIGTYWPLVSRLGHQEYLEQFEKEKRPKHKYVPLKKWGNYHFGRWVPDVGF